jgi:chromosome segregation protein
LLKLKRVEIHGFKSFYDRTELKFNGTGIAAVVGPNGCGKSNLSDAISWVLGEQSAKTLRGARMEDVIFAGSRDRKALGMASVTLTMIPQAATLPEPVNKDADAAIPVAQNGELARTAERGGEVTITRRLYRSGESEYLINGKAARLRDIQDLFLGTGLGPESYAIIEQGRIGQILSNRPQDRRNVIEEAAGITKFRTRKRLAEAKLESAKQNLSRVFDILEEVTRQANTLKRQAAKTKRYGELQTEAKGYLREILTEKFRRLEREMAKITIELNLAASALANTQGAVKEREAAQDEVLERSYATEQRLTAARKHLADLKLEGERARGKLEYQTRQVAQISQSLETGEREAAALERLAGERSAELDGQAAELGEVEANCTALEQQLAAKAAARGEAQKRAVEQERTLEGMRQNVLRLLGECSGLKNRITHIEAQLAASQRDAARAEAEEQQSLADSARLEQARAQLSQVLSDRQTGLLSVGEARKEVEGELKQKRGELQQNRQTLDRLRGEVSRVKARKDSISDIIQHRSYTTETVKRLFTAAGRGKTEGFQPVGVFADFLEVDAQWEKAAEEFLHDELEFVVVKDWTEGERGIELMRDDLNGRATFLVESAGQAGPATAEVPQPFDEGGSLTPLSDTLRWTNGLSSIPKEQLPRIANCYVATERELARQLATQFPHCWFLTPDGVNYHGQSVSGGKKSGAGPLALKRELRDLVQLESATEEQLSTASQAVSRLEAEIGALNEELERLRAQQQAQEKDVLALDHESRKLAEESQRIQARLSHARLELRRIASERVKLDEELAQDRETLVSREQARGAEEASLEAAREHLQALQAILAAAAEEHSGLRAHLASIEERRRSLGASRARLQAQLSEVVERRAHLLRQTERLAVEKAHLLTSNAELEERVAELGSALEAAEQAVVSLAEEETEVRAHLARGDEDLKRLRAEAQERGEQRAALQVEFARAESSMKHLEESCAAEFKAPLGQLAASSETVMDEAGLEQAELRYAEARRKIEALGPVNPKALEEFEEAQQRQEFLTAQRQDLLDGIRDTEKAIHEIDLESRKRFQEAFHAINANFREMFQTLFGGGVGEMRLTDEDNLAESGIEIVASPPGKRLQNVLLLSGGEKSLTAMALLMAIFQYTPSPFCILDEVDAPLDEPNIERLTRLLKEMSQDTQFIVITHAKRTMESAQALYGVTMQEPGVSKLVSVKFRPELEEQPESVRAPAVQRHLAASLV